MEATYFLRARYVQAIEDMGGIPILLAPTDDSSVERRTLQQINGLLVTGAGSDLHPGLFGERKKFPYDVMSPHRARFELSITKRALRMGMPVFGTCGGLQVMNVALGGSLIQDITGQIPGALAHRLEPTYGITWHSVEVNRGTRLSKIIKKKTMRVNSSHHQSPGRIARGLIVNAISADGVIEGLEAIHHRFAIGVQWHPETLYRKDEATKRLYKAFLKEASR